MASILFPAAKNREFNSYKAGESFGILFVQYRPNMTGIQLSLAAKTLKVNSYINLLAYQVGFQHGYCYQRTRIGNPLPLTVELEEQENILMAKVSDNDNAAILERARKNAKTGVSNADKQAYVNNVEFSGRLGKDVELTYTPNGSELVKTSLAVWMPQGKDKDALTLWLEVVIWSNDDNAIEVAEALKHQKGENVVVKGRLTMREYNGKTYYGITAISIL